MLNVIKITGPACFVVQAKPGTLLCDGEEVLVGDLARSVAEALSAATGASAVVVPEGVLRIDLVVGEPAPLSAREVVGLPPARVPAEEPRAC